MKMGLIAGYETLGAYLFFFLCVCVCVRGTNREREREMSCDLRSFSGLERGTSRSEDPS